MFLNDIVARQERLAARLGKMTDAFRRIVNAEVEHIRKHGSPKVQKRNVKLYLDDELRAELEREQGRWGLKSQRDTIYVALLVGYKVMLGCRPDEDMPSNTPKFPAPRVVWPPENAEKDRIERVKQAIRESERKP